MPAAAPSAPALARAVPPAASSYWALSRAPRYSLTFALPLLLAYEALAALLGRAGGGGVRNGADVWIKTPFVAAFGAEGPLVFAGVVAAVATGLVALDLRRARGGLRAGVFARMFAESAAMAVVCGVVVGLATTRLLQALSGHGLALLASATSLAAAPALAATDGPVAALAWPTQLMVSLGAGLYEELLFRVVLVSTLVLVLRRFVGLGEVAAGVGATLGGAVLFALAHHVGPLGEPFTVAAFTFRTLAGLFFSALYVARAFGITAWTHALYDVMVLVA